METKKKYSSSFLISFIWLTILTILEVISISFLNVAEYSLLPFDGALLGNIISHIFIFSPFIIAIFVSSYFFIATQRKYLSFFLGSIINIIVLYAFIFSLADYFFYGAASASGKYVALSHSPIVIIISLILLALNLKIISKNDFQVKILFLKITKNLSIFYIIKLVYIMFNTIIIFIAISTGAVYVCELNSGFFPPAIQPHSNSYRYPDTCLVEMGKKGYIDACSIIDYERNRNKCYLEVSLYTDDKTICEKVGTGPPAYYISCIFRKNIIGHHPADRCMHSSYRIQDYGEDVTFKECVQNKFKELQIK